VPNLDDSEASQQALWHYNNTVAHIRSKQSAAETGGGGEEWGLIATPEE
jgi:hypothetical protein